MAKSGNLSYIMQNWNFSKEHVDQSINRGRFISSKTVLLVAVDNPDEILAAISNGDASVPSITGTPIGVISNWSIVQQKMLQRLFEIGSSLSYIIPGNTTASLNIGRVIYSGSTILAEAYNFKASAALNEDKMEAGFKLESEVIGTETDPQWFALNLAAKIFDKATTMVWLIKNNDNITVGAFLFVDAQIESHQISGDAQSVIILENATMQFTKVYPISMTGA